MDRKNFKASISGDEGTVSAEIATLMVKDHDGDVTRSGFFPSKAQAQEVPLLIGHDWYQLPVGKGIIFEEGQVAKFVGEFNLKSTIGLDAWETAKFMGQRQEWSYGYDLAPGSFEKGIHEGEQVRFLGPAKGGGAGVIGLEASTVVAGAGIGTRTTTVKDKYLGDLSETIKTIMQELAESEDPDPHLKFIEEAGAVLTAVAHLEERAADISAKRAANSNGAKRLSPASVEALGEVVGKLGDAAKTLDLVISAPTTADLQAEFLRHQKRVAHDLGAINA